MSENLTPSQAHINARTDREQAESLWHNPLAPELRQPDVYAELGSMLADDSPLVRSREAELLNGTSLAVGRISPEVVKEDFQKHQCITVTDDSEAATRALELLSHAPSQQPPTEVEAPFAGHSSNNDLTWQAVSDQTVRDYLGSRSFIKDINFSADDRVGYNLAIETPRHQSLPVRLDLLVQAAGFDSWHGRGEHGPNGDASKSTSSTSYGNWPSTSLNTIKHYAALSSELPSVGRIQAYVQPDGQVFCDNGAGDSHRIAAAMLRGDEFIQADALDITLLKRNLLPPQPQTA